jgi:hypothetical protein
VHSTEKKIQGWADTFSHLEEHHLISTSPEKYRKNIAIATLQQLLREQFVIQYLVNSVHFEMAEFSESCPLKINMLVVYDIDTRVASQLAEKFVSSTTKFDLIIILGPFTHDNKLISDEDIAVAEGDMASAIAQLESISCRVVYLPGENDPLNTLIEQLHLTPNSVNLHARRLPLRDGLFITGFTETGDNLEKRGVPDDVDRSDESDEELEDVEVSSGTDFYTMIITFHELSLFVVIQIVQYFSFFCIGKSIMKTRIDSEAAFKIHLSIN